MKVMMALLRLFLASEKVLTYSKGFACTTRMIRTTKRTYFSQDYTALSLPTSADGLLNTPPQSWLVVGDGDLSFSASLASNLYQKHIILVASVLEDQETHQQVYQNSRQNCQTIVGHRHGLQFGVDAMQLECFFESNQFDCIIFNFPHWRGKSNNRHNRRLLQGFLQSASKILKPHGQIQVAFISGQGGMEATSIRDWRQSWMAPMYAAECGLLLKSIAPFQVCYNTSAYRGHDRSFRVGEEPLRYIFGLSDGKCTAKELQIACRHELRIILDDNTLQSCPCSNSDLVDGNVVMEIIQSVTPEGIHASIAHRSIVQLENQAPILVFLVVYRGERYPLSRFLADSIRAQVENGVQDDIKLQLGKKGRRVSKPFPYRLLDSVLRAETQ